MPSVRSMVRSTGAVVVGLLAQQSFAGNCTEPDWTCESYAVDFHNGGTYFQNIASTDNFTFASQYEECQAVTAYNVLVKPNGDEIICSDTTLTPDDTTEVSTCNIEKADLESGDYSVLIYSNNGDCAPIAYSRNFVLSVGTQVTSTLTPGVTFTSTSTPVKTVTTTSTSTFESDLSTATVTSSKSVKSPTRTVTPKTTTTTTTTLATKTLTRYNLVAIKTLQTVTAKCTQSSVAKSADPTATSTPTSSVPAYTSSAAARMMVRSPMAVEDIVGDKAAFLQQRAESLEHVHALQKRDIDSATIYIVQSSTITTATSTIYASTVTTTSTSVVTKSTTVTPIPVTLYLNPITTVTAATSTISKTRTINMVTTWVTATHYSTVKITTTVTPTAKAAACTSKGGYMH